MRRAFHQLAIRLLAVLAVLAVVAVLPCSACQDRRGLTSGADALLASLARGDLGAFEQLASPRLAQTFDGRRFRQLAAALRRLGALRGRTLRRAALEAGRGDSGHFELRFAKGRLQLQLSVARGRVLSFEMAGPALERALRLERQGFLVDRVRVLGADGSVAGLAAEEPLVVELSLAGLTAKEGKVGVRVSLQAFTGGTQLASSQPRLLEQLRRAPAPGGVAIFTGRTRLPAGDLRVLLTIDDLWGRRLRHALRVRVGAARSARRTLVQRPSALPLPLPAPTTRPTHDPTQ